ncbi:MAG: hypothetical protein WED07_02875 [Candidatus Freyarchaeum deiterrae]
MFVKQGVCFAVFDENEGPICVHFKGIERPIAEKIALKSMVAALSFSQQVEEGESIIPLQEEKRNAFVYYFSVADEKARGKERVGTLNFVVNREDGDALYRFAPILLEHSKRIVQDIKKYYVYRQPIPQVLMDSVNSILSIDFERVALPVIFEEYLIQIYLSRNTTFHRSIVEKTNSISRNEEIFGDKIGIVGRDENQNIVWILLSCNFSKMSNEQKQKLYGVIDKLGNNIPSLEVTFVLNELGLRKDGSFDEKMIEKITRISRTKEVEGKEFDLCGTNAGKKIVWALLSKNFLAMDESDMDELNRKIYRLKRENPSMEAFFTLAEILRTTKLQPPKSDFEEKPTGIKKRIGIKTEFQSYMKTLREEKK